MQKSAHTLECVSQRSHLLPLTPHTHTAAIITIAHRRAKVIPGIMAHSHAHMNIFFLGGGGLATN